MIKVGRRCSQRCLFCHAVGAPAVELSDDAVLARIARAAELGHDRVAFSGGEPTLRRALPCWAERAAALGLDVGLVSNGAGLDAALVERLPRLRAVQISLHGPEAVQRRLAGRDDARAALDVLAGRGLDVVVNAVVCAVNLDHLDELVDELAARGGVRLKLSAVDEKGGAADAGLGLVPPLAATAAAVAAACRRAERAGLVALHDGLPLCLLPGLEDRRSDLRAAGFTRLAEPEEDDLFPVDDRERVHPLACAPCRHRGACPGLHRATLAAQGAAALHAIRGPRPMVVPFVLEAYADIAEGVCPVGRLAPWDRGRHLFVRRGQRVARYFAPGREVADVDLLSLRAAGQLYLEPTPGHLAPLMPTAACGRCSDRAGCVGVLEPTLEDVAANAAAWAEEHGAVPVAALGDRLTHLEPGERVVVVDEALAGIAAPRSRWPDQAPLELHGAQVQSVWSNPLQTGRLLGITLQSREGA